MFYDWDSVIEVLEEDSMRPVRYGKCFRYLRDADRNSKLLEVGCGEGTGLLIAKQLGFRNLVGVEVSLERLKKTKHKVWNEAFLILVAEDNHMPFSDGYFDIVVSAAIIEHTYDAQGFVKEIARVVRRGGYVIISSDCYQWRILQLLGIYRSVQPIDRALFPTQFFNIFKESGLKVVHYEGFPWPRQKFRFVRMIWKRIVEFFRIQKIHPNLINEKIDHKSNSNHENRLEKFINETWNPRQGINSFLKLIFSDENVFFLTKQR